MTNNEIQKNYVQNILLGEDSYFSVVGRIYELIKNAQAKTIQGTEFLSKMYDSLNESITPILTLKPFVTGGESLASDDITVKEVINFIKKSTKGNADLNFLINLCKEEHYSEMLRTGHPSPKSTVQEIEKEFRKTNNEIQDAIKNGIFDDLKSSLLGSIKKQLGYNENQKTTSDEKLEVANDDKSLNENNAIYNGNFVRYNPVGFMFFDKTKGSNLNLVENEVILIDEDDLGVERVQVIQNNQVNVPEEHQKLIKAVQSCPYDPETNQFFCKEDWDFTIALNPDGTIEVKNKNGDIIEVDPKDVKQIFIESISLYEKDPLIVPQFVKERYMVDADNFIALMNNANSLIRFNNLEVVRNINESISSRNYVMIHKSSFETPKIISNGHENNLLFEDYKSLCESCNRVFGDNTKNLFESIFKTKLDEEELFNHSKIQHLADLNEEQRQLNKKIDNVRNLKTAAEDNSPAMEQLNKQEFKLLEKLNESLEESAKTTSTKLCQ